MMVTGLRQTIWRTRLRLGGRCRRYLAQLRLHEFVSPQEVTAIQHSRLEHLLRWASREVPYWARELDKNRVVLRSGTVRLDGFLDLPVTAKKLMRERPTDLRSRTRLPGEYENSSGGSTGEPVRFIQHKEYADWGRAVTELFDEWSGYKLGEAKIGLWGSERDLLWGRETLAVRVGRLLRNETWLNAFRMDESKLGAYVREINRRRPVQVLAYVEAAAELAQYVERSGARLAPPRSVMTSAGTLYPSMRVLIEQSFRAPVFDRYGSREVGNIASECRAHTGLHVSPFTHFVEVLRPDGSPAKSGEIGRVIITQLTNRAMPFIRFEIGDLGVWAEGKCVCGRHWPRLERVVGRESSLLRTPSGTIDGVAVTTLFYFKDRARTKAFGALAKYQVYQPRVDHVILRVVVADPDLWIEEGPVIMSKLRRLLGSDVRLDIEEVREIPPAPSGKYMYVWSEVSSPGS